VEKMKNMLWIAFLAGLLASCGKRELKFSESSIQNLAEEVLEAVESNDPDALLKLRINEREFKKYLWPEFPASDPKMNVPFSFAWGNLDQKSEKGARRALSQYGGNAYRFETIYFQEKTEEYSGFKLYSQSVIVAKDNDGNLHELQFCGSIVERNGEYKFLSYRD
jgi:hypothetical protein